MTLIKHNSNTEITNQNGSNLSTVGNEGSYKLSLLHQHSLEVDSFMENGLQKSVHYVIKNSAFVLKVGLQKIDRAASSSNPISDNENSLELIGNGEALDFRNITLEATLLYDCEEEKQVVKVIGKPLTTRGSLSSSSNNVYNIDTTIHVLSSQNEDMNFRIKLTPMCAITSKPIKEIMPIYTAPMQVISKPEVLIKKKQRTKRGPRKQTKQDQILEILHRMEAKQNSQKAHIDLLVNKSKNILCENSSLQNKTTNNDFTSILNSPIGCKRSYATAHLSQYNTPEPPTPSLETAYFNFVAAYEKSKKNERPKKLRKIFANSSPTELKNFTEAYEFLRSQQLYPQQQHNLIIPKAELSPLMFDPEDINLDQLFADLA